MSIYGVNFLTRADYPYELLKSLPCYFKCRNVKEYFKDCIFTLIMKHYSVFSTIVGKFLEFYLSGLFQPIIVKRNILVLLFIDLEWKIIYVGSAESEEYDQVLDSVLVGPVPAGRHMFVFQVC